MARVENGKGSSVAVKAMTDPTGAQVVKLIGEIDISNADTLEAKLDQIVGQGTERLVFDLGALEFMDSSGIAMLIRITGRVETFEIRNPSTIVRRIIECTGLGAVLPIES